MHHRALKIGLGLVVTIVCLVAALWGIEWNELKISFRNANYASLGTLTVLLAVFYWLKAKRWSLLLQPLRRFRTGEVVPALMIGFMGNNVLPAHLGELVRVWVLGRQSGLPKAAILSTVVLERVFDLVVVLAMLGGGLLLVPEIPGEVQAASLTIAGLTALGVGLLVIYIRWTSAFVAVGKWMLAKLPFVPTGGTIRSGSYHGNRCRRVVVIKARIVVGPSNRDFSDQVVCAGRHDLCLASQFRSAGQSGHGPRGNGRHRSGRCRSLGTRIYRGRTTLFLDYAGTAGYETGRRVCGLGVLPAGTARSGDAGGAVFLEPAAPASGRLGTRSRKPRRPPKSRTPPSRRRSARQSGEREARSCAIDAIKSKYCWRTTGSLQRSWNAPSALMPNCRRRSASSSSEASRFASSSPVRNNSPPWLWATISGNGPEVAGDDRRPLAKSLQHDHRENFVAQGRDHDPPRAAIKSPQLVLSLLPQKPYAGIPLRQLPQRRLMGPTAGNPQLTLPLTSKMRDHILQALDRFEPADEQKIRWGVGRRRTRGSALSPPKTGRKFGSTRIGNSNPNSRCLSAQN